MYDVIIIGAGPAGLTAGLYSARSELKTLIIEKAVEGGQISQTARVDNYPAANDNPDGMTLAEKIKDQALTQGCEFVNESVEEVDLKSDIKKIKTDLNTYETKTVIIATGAQNRLLNVPGEEEFKNLGVSYCATCDGPFYKDMDIYVVGGGEAAVEEAIYLTRFGKKVHIIHRREGFRASESTMLKARENEKIDFILNYVVKEIKGKNSVNELVLENVIDKSEKRIIADDLELGIGVFIFIGSIPETGIFEGQIEMEKGYILTDEDMNTNIEGVFAVGDTRKKKVRQMVTAASDGCIAAILANEYIGGKIWNY